jgi:hypothetical protein
MAAAGRDARFAVAWCAASYLEALGGPLRTYIGLHKVTTCRVAYVDHTRTR